MLSFFQTSFTGAIANRQFLEITSNNLANLNTNAFRASRAEFADRLYKELTGANVGLPPESKLILPEVGTGVSLIATSLDLAPGSLNITNDPLHLAILGRGFFPVLQLDGSVAYTRDGAFGLDAARNIVHSSGYLLQPPVSVPADAQELTILPNGLVRVRVPDPADPAVLIDQTLGTIQIATFPNERNLEAVGSNLFVETPASGAPTLTDPQLLGAGSVESGALETANVEPITEITNIMAAQRAYQLNISALRQMDEMLALATRMRR